MVMFSCTGAEKSGPATYAYDVRIGLLQDKTFKDLGTVHRDKTQTEHGFVSIVPDGQDFQIAWLDGRKTAGGHHGSDDHHSGDQAMTLRYSRYTPQGLTPSIELDDRVCDCCNTSAVQLTSGSRLFIAIAPTMKLEIYQSRRCTKTIAS